MKNRRLTDGPAHANCWLPLLNRFDNYSCIGHRTDWMGYKSMKNLIQDQIEECLSDIEAGTGKLIEGLEIKRSGALDNIESWARNLAKDVSGLDD